MIHPKSEKQVEISRTLQMVMIIGSALSATLAGLMLSALEQETVQMTTICLGITIAAIIASIIVLIAGLQGRATVRPPTLFEHAGFMLTMMLIPVMLLTIEINEPVYQVIARFMGWAGAGLLATGVVAASTALALAFAKEQYGIRWLP